MPDQSARLQQAEQVLRRMEIRIEQQHIHVLGLAAQPDEAAKARMVLEKMTAELERQRKYCNLLATSKGVEDLAPTDRIAAPARAA